MNVRLQYDFDFVAGIWYEGELQFNSYSICMSLLTQSTDAAITNIAMERIKTFLSYELGNVVFINREYESQAELFQALGCNVCTLPDEPVDQIIGMMLYCKLNAITEGQLLVTSLDISSEMGGSVWYQHDEEDLLGPFSKEGWWHQASTQKDTLDPEQTPDNVVKVQTTGWHELGLEWPELKADIKTDNIVFPDFKKHENK